MSATASLLGWAFCGFTAMSCISALLDQLLGNEVNRRHNELCTIGCAIATALFWLVAK